MDLKFDQKFQLELFHDSVVICFSLIRITVKYSLVPSSPVGENRWLQNSSIEIPVRKIADFDYILLNYSVTSHLT